MKGGVFDMMLIHSFEFNCAPIYQKCYQQNKSFGRVIIHGHVQMMFLFFCEMWYTVGAGFNVFFVFFCFFFLLF